MKSILLICFIILGITCRSQSFELPKELYSFYDVIEWKGNGGMLLNRDPSGNMRKVYLTFVSNLPNSTWNQSFNPKGSDFYYISSENARYTYFLDNLNLEEGKYFFTQLNTPGNVKSSSTLLLQLFKKLGDFELSELKLIDIVTTDKALIHLFRYHNSKEKKYVDIAIFMTHHNLISYGCILGETLEANLKEGISDYWKYIGSTGDQIYFAARENQSKQKGWSVKETNSKSELLNSTYIKDSELTFELIENKGFGTTGQHYLNAKGEIASSVLTHFNGKYYLNGITAQNGKRELKSFKLTDGKWELMSSSVLDPLKGKETVKLGVSPINEGLGVKVDQILSSSVIFSPFDKSKEIIVTPFTEKLTFNPSRMIVKEHKNEFVINLPDRNVFFDYKQLNNSGSVKFEIVKR